MTFAVNSSPVVRQAFPPQVIRYSDNVIEKKDSEVESKKQSQNDTLKGVGIGTTLTALAALGLYLLTKGKGKVPNNVGGKAVETVTKPIEEMIERTEESIKAAEARFARNEARSVTTDRKVVANIETSNANASSRKLVEDALRDTPTEKDIKAFHDQIAYKPAKAKDVAAAKEKGIKFVEQEGANATQKLSDAKGADKLEKVAAKVEEEATQGIKDGKYCVEYASGKYGTYTVKDGKIVEAQVDEMTGKINDVKLAKHYDKYDILGQITKGGSNVVPV